MIQAFLEKVPTQQETNVFGNVHGGTIIQLMCATSQLVVEQYQQQLSNTPQTPKVLSEIQHLDYLKPMRPGETLHCQSTLDKTSPALTVQANVYRENDLVAKGVIVFT